MAAGLAAQRLKTAAKQPVKNVDLWQRLVAAMAPHQVTWHWVKCQPLALTRATSAPTSSPARASPTSSPPPLAHAFRLLALKKDDLPAELIRGRSE